MHVIKYHPKQHKLNKNLVDQDALSAIKILQKAGHTAYLVGGGVRDLLLGIAPKDFDISTSARPDEIKKIFQRQCLLIGRRFRLAHLRYGKKILEVSTFRAGNTESASLITRDNHWGTEKEDVLRRDFTMNALFYDPEHETIIDYIGGYTDIQQKTLKTIGDPSLRFKQDPVRMLRLLKFQARFDFLCENQSLAALQTCRYEILKSAPARLLEEMFKMLESTKAEKFFLLLVQYKFLELIFPCFQHFFSSHTKEIAYSYLKAIDTSKIGLSRPVLLASIIYPILEEEICTLVSDRCAPLSMHEITHLIQTLLHGIQTSSFVHFPKKLLGSIYSTILNQYRLTPIKGTPRYHARFSSKEDFLLSLDLLSIRANIHPHLKATFLEWKERRG